MTDLNDVRDDSPSKLSRRRVVAGTAWAVPIVVGVGAAPAWAFSSGAPVSVSVSGKVITFVFQITGFQPWDTVTFVSARLGTSPTGALFSWLTVPVAGPPTVSGTTRTYTFVGVAQNGAGSPTTWTARFIALTKTGSGTLTNSTTFVY